MTPSQFLSILKARWVSALFVLLLTVAVTLAVSLMLPKSYTASSAVLVDMRPGDPVSGPAYGGGMNLTYIATQVDILRSDRVALRVVENLKLAENPATRQQWTISEDGKGSYEMWLANLIKSKLEVRPSKESSVIDVSYSNHDPRFAMALANAYVQAFIDTSISLRAQSANQYDKFFDARSKEAKERLEKAQGRLADYLSANSITVTDERFDIETQRLNELSSQLVAIQAATAESRSRTAQARTSGDQIQEVINNSLVVGLRADASRQDARLKELTARLGDAHPQVIEMRANIAELNARIDTEVRRVSSSVSIGSTINAQREKEIQSALDAQRTKVLKLKAQRNEINVLQQEVDRLSAMYGQVNARQSQSNLESQNTQTNFTVLTRATEPTKPSSPRIVLNTILSVGLGAVLAIGFALLREMSDRRVRTLDDLTEAFDLPVLGILPKPSRQARLGRDKAMVLPAHLVAQLPGNHK